MIHHNVSNTKYRIEMNKKKKKEREQSKHFY